MIDRPDRRPLLAAGLLLGAGLGGFVDGIAFHQLLQLHNMISARRPVTTLVNAEINMFWDGVFHAATWLTTVLGLVLLWRAGHRPDVPWSGRTLLGAILLGTGLFNLVEGVIDHHVLHLHHVVEAPGHLPYDVAFLVVGGLAPLALGWLLARAGRADATPRGAAP